MTVTRRIKLSTVVSLLGALLVAAVAFAPGAQVAAAWEKMDVCHVTNVPAEGDGVVISIADPAWDAHEAHGDKTIDDDNLVTVYEDGTCHVSTAPALEAVDDQVTTPVDTPVTIDVLANDNYVDSVAVSVQVFPQYGTLGIQGLGIFEYTPNAGFIGTDSFTYQICETDGQCDAATVTIIVGP
jgi:hypothetical protein